MEFGLADDGYIGNIRDDNISNDNISEAEDKDKHTAVCEKHEFEVGLALSE